MTSFENFHVVYLNPDEIMKAKFSLFLYLNSRFTKELLIDGICGNIVSLNLKAEYNTSASPHCKIYANVIAKTGETSGETRRQYFFKCSSNLDNPTDIVLNTEAGWQMLGTVQGSYINILTLTLEVFKHMTALYKELYNDTDLTDFELRVEGSEEAIQVHRNILALNSPVLKAVVQGSWTESKQRYIEVPDASIANLRDFKKYIYLKELPESPMSCAGLLPLASYYMMQELKKEATLKIAEIFKPEEGWDWFENYILYVVQHKSYHLLTTLLKNTDSDKIKALEEHFSTLTTSTEK